MCRGVVESSEPMLGRGECEIGTGLLTGCVLQKLRLGCKGAKLICKKLTQSFVRFYYLDDFAIFLLVVNGVCLDGAVEGTCECTDDFWTQVFEVSISCGRVYVSITVFVMLGMNGAYQSLVIAGHSGLQPPTWLAHQTRTQIDPGSIP